MINKGSEENIFILSPFLYLQPTLSVKNYYTDYEAMLSDELRRLLVVCMKAESVTNLSAIFPLHLLQYAIEKRFIVSTNAIFHDYCVHIAEIEVNTNCNCRCIYCPVSTNPVEKQIMSMDVYDEIIEKLVRYGHIKFISLNFYNEPTLDRYFERRVSRLQNTGIRLILHTNGTGLTREKSEFLSHQNFLHRIQVNLPAADPLTYQSMTGRHFYDKVVQNLLYASEFELPLGITVNGSQQEIQQNIKQIETLFQGKGMEVTQAYTTDRAGALHNQYSQKIHIRKKLTGCLTKNIVFGWNGDIQLCCNDYFRKNRVGNICDGEIQDIIDGNMYQDLLLKIFGFRESDMNFVCRKCFQIPITMAKRAALINYLKNSETAVNEF